MSGSLAAGLDFSAIVQWSLGQAGYPCTSTGQGRSTLVDAAKGPKKDHRAHRLSKAFSTCRHVAETRKQCWRAAFGTNSTAQSAEHVCRSLRAESLGSATADTQWRFRTKSNRFGVRKPRQNGE